MDTSAFYTFTEENEMTLRLNPECEGENLIVENRIFNTLNNVDDFVKKNSLEFKDCIFPKNINDVLIKYYPQVKITNPILTE